VSPSKLDSALGAIDSLDVDGLETGTVIGPGYGGVRFLVWAGPSTADESDRARGLAVSFREQVARLEGRMIVESCSPKIKAGLDVWGKVPGGLEVMRRLKREIDPNGVFNPGRFVEGI
jgi:glycolate oxidase FAD binding subunit